MVHRRLLVMALGFILLDQLYAQQHESENEPAYDLKVPVNLVLVPVTVEDNEGKLIHNLGKNDFELSENGASQKISYFSVDPSPLSVAFLIDRTVDEHTQQIFKQ